MIETLDEFKIEVMRVRVAFGNNCLGCPQQERRDAYFRFMKGNGIDEEVIEFSMGEFLPLDREHRLEQMLNNKFPAHLR